MVRLGVGVALIGLLICLSSPRASAQVGSNCISFVYCGQYSLLNANCDPPLPPITFDCYGSLWTTVCEVMNSLCAAAGAAAETPCPYCTAKGGPPVSLTSGNTYITETDLDLPGLGGGLTLLRTWNSMWPATQTAFQIGMFGPNWRCNFEERVFVGADHYMKYARGDGSFWSFGYNGGNYSVVAPANFAATLSQGANDWKVTFKDGEQRLFDNTSGKLVEIIDRNGNTTQLTYDSLGRLSTVTDPASRHLYFSYGGSTTLVAGVTTDFSESLSYSYDTQGRMSQYTQVDGTTISFQYDANSFISQVTDQNGKVLEAHTYDSSGRGLTASRANGVNAFSLTYSN